MENLYFTVNSGFETKRIKDLLPKYLNGVWGEYSNDENGTPVLRSTEQNVEGVLTIVEPAILEIKKVGKNNKLKNKDLLLTKSSGSKEHIGKCSYITSENGEGYCFSNFMMGIRFGNSINSKFLQYCINNILIKKQINNNSLNITLNNLTNESVGQLLIPIPNLELQNAIANYLNTETSKIDLKISILEQKFEKLEEYKQSVIFETVTKGLDKNVPMKDSGIDWIGEIPKHWEVKRVKDLLSLKGGGVDKKINENEKLVKLVNFVDVFKKIPLNNNQEYMIVSCPEHKIKSVTLKKDDILITPSSETPKEIGLANIVLEDLESTVFSYHIQRLRNNFNLLNPKYTYYYFNSKFAAFQFEEKALGTTRVTLSRHDINSNIIFSPPIEEQDVIVGYINGLSLKIDNKKDIIKKQIKLLKEYKQTVMYEAVTGKMEIL